MRSSVRGFTLIELIVAITLLSMLVLATVTAMRTLATTQELLEARVERMSETTQVSRFLRGVITSAVPVKVTELGVPSGYFFQGEQDSLQWMAPLPWPGPGGGVGAIKLERDGTDLVVKAQPGSQVPAWSEDDTSFILVDEVEEFSLAYRSSAYAEWQAHWYSGGSAEMPFPSHLRLRLKAQGRYWPDVIVSFEQAEL